METRTDRQSAGGPDIAPTLASTAPGTICRVPAGVVETHISILFFVGDRVFKLRKPVQFGFVDFRQREARRQDCEREVALNQRLAPDVYLGVADLSLQGVPLDHMVVMRRMPEDRRLATMALRGDDLGEPVHQIARTMATFHRRAARSATISAEATAEAVGAGWEQNLQETSRFVGTVLDAEIDAAIRALAARWVSGRAPLLKARIAAGHVCDGHGDLQAGDIFCLPDGVRILDCLEFSDHLRYADVCADVAFLAMDLERLGFREAAGQFVVAYEEAAHDRFPDTLVHFSCASRAYVRAKVACLRAEQGASDAAAEARLLHDLALQHLRQAQVKLVVVGGLPGSGKSTVAAGVSHETSWPVIRSDEVRREITPDGVERYGQEATARTYGELLRRAEGLLGLGQSVLLDASFVQASRRAGAAAVADRTQSDLVELRCHAPADTEMERVRRRLAEGTDLSEATPKVAAAMATAMDPWPTSHLITTAEGSAEVPIGRVLHLLEFRDFRHGQG